MQQQLIRQRMLMQNAVVTQCMLHLMVVPLGERVKNATCPYIMYPSNSGFCWCLENCKRLWPSWCNDTKNIAIGRKPRGSRANLDTTFRSRFQCPGGWEVAQALRVGYTELSAKKTVMKPEYPSTYISTYYISTYILIVRPSAS
jgi:hypothetical protein